MKDLILKHKPQHVVECGALTGNNTKLLAELRNEFPFKFTVITDNEFSLDGVEVMRGISYKALESMPDDSIDMCIIDTDHNYWTLTKELEALNPKLRKDGIVCMHDINTFYHNTGVSIAYENGDPYPLKEIEETGATHGSLGNAVIDFLHKHPFDYKLLRYSEESHGGLAIQKCMVKVLTYFATNRTSEVDDILKNRGAQWTEAKAAI